MRVGRPGGGCAERQDPDTLCAGGRRAPGWPCPSRCRGSVPCWPEQGRPDLPADPSPTDTRTPGHWLLRGQPSETPPAGWGQTYSRVPSCPDPSAPRPTARLEPGTCSVQHLALPGPTSQAQRGQVTFQKPHSQAQTVHPESQGGRHPFSGLSFLVWAVGSQQPPGTGPRKPRGANQRSGLSSPGGPPPHAQLPARGWHAPTLGTQSSAPPGGHL